MIVVATLSFYITGLLIFLIWGKVNGDWADWYYLWDKGKDLLFIICLHLCSSKKYRWVVKYVMFYAAIRFIWEIISTITGVNVNSTEAIGWLFIAMSLVCSYLTLKELLTWRR